MLTLGLSEQEAQARLKRDGYNDMPYLKPKRTLTILLETIKEPMFLLLIAAGIVYLLFGNLQDALVLLCFVVVVLIITFYQEYKTERTLLALRDLS
ncbi:MAG: cation-transporting P-type ATPase, partial [candidate division WOR-3 bacterium]|nr:cation-transporting P-type ATPase [candidate division WOR-3 bacterium]